MKRSELVKLSLPNPKPRDPLNSTCILDVHVLDMVQSLVLGQKFKKLWLSALCQLNEALVLYDQIYVFHPNPLGSPYILYYWMDEPVTTLNEQETDVIQPVSLYKDRDELEQASASLKKPNVIYQSNLSPVFSCDDNYLFEAENLLRETDGRSGVLKSAEMSGINHDLLYGCLREDRPLLEKHFAGNRLWQLDMARQLREKHEAQGIMYRPDLTPIINEQRERVWSKLHKRFSEFQDAIVNEHIPEDHQLDLSPLSIILLDTCVSRESIPTTLAYMRRDYAEIRRLGKNYAKHMAAAETYREISDVKHEWANTWTHFMGRIGKPKVPLFRRLLGWDLIARHSITDLITKTITLAQIEIAEAKFRRSMNLATEFEAEFLNSRLVERNISRLFGDSVETHFPEEIL